MSNQEDDSTGGPEVVDFDALNAALGALPAPASSSSPVLTDSEGRSSATYSSARPHTIPPSNAPNEDPNAPAVIVQTDETIPTGPPVQMTMPMGPGVNVVGTAPHPAAGMPAEGMRPPMASSPSHAFTPQPFPHSGPPSDGAVNATLPMATAPLPPRRPRTPTIVVRTHSGPSRAQKLAVFISMLVVFVGGGIAFLLIYKPSGINLDFRSPIATTRTTPAAVMSVPPAASLSTSSAPSASTPPPPPTASASASASSSATPALSAAPSASATVKKPKPKPPAPPSTGL